jgi:hypothetical protein
VGDFGTFSANANATTAFGNQNTAPGGTAWNAFRAVTTNSIPSGQLVDVVFDITSSGTAQDVINSLKNGNLVGTGQTENNDMQFAAGHVQVLTGLPSSDAVPSLTFYGLIVLALLLAGTAVWMFRSRKVGVA